MSKTSAKEVPRRLEESYDKKKFGIVDEKHVLFEEYSKGYLNFQKPIKHQRVIEEIEQALKIF